MNSKQKKTILLVEDDPLATISGRKVLERYAFRVLTAASGKEALSVFDNDKSIDLILMDINLGDGMDGTEAASRILEKRELPVIFLSSHTEREVVEKTEGITSYGYIVKNSGETVLIASIKMAFRLYEARISEKNKSEMLSENEEKTRFIFNAITDAVFLHPHMEQGFGCFEEVNTTACERYGYSHEEFLELTPADITVKPDSDTHGNTEHRNSLKNSGQMTFETIHLTKTGQEIPVEINSTVVKLGGRFMILSVARDITERKKTEKAMQESERGYKDLINGMNDTAFVIDLDGSIIDVNNRAVRNLEYSREELVKMNVLDIDHTIDKDYFEELLKTMPDDKFQIIETFHRSKTGKLYPVEIYSSLVTYRGSQAIFCIVRDTSYRKNAEKRLREQLEEKEILLRAVHHRIKNNIASIESLLALQAGKVTVPEASTILQDTMGRIKCMRVLYDNLLLSGDFRNISLKKYITNIMDSIVEIFPDRGNISINEEIEEISIDEKQLFPLGVIIEELITNIMKYAFTEENTGNIINISLNRAGRGAVLKICDNGAGLPEGFDLEKSRGFGLMIVKMLSRQLDGAFTIETGKGTTCTIYFET